MRLVVALGLNSSELYTTSSNPLVLPKLSLCDPNNPVESERLRNFFWSSYIFDRQCV